MTVWSGTPPILGLVEGRPSYSAGSFDSSRGPGRFYITGIAVATNVVTLTVAIVEGNIPAVGDSVTVVGSIVPAANITATLTGVTITAATGVGTLTYAATTANLGQQASGGSGTIAVPEVPETNTPNQAYRAFGMPRRVRDIGMRPSLTLNVRYPSAPGVISWAVQGAINNIEAEYVTLFSGAAAGTFTDSGAPAGVATTVQFWPGSFNFVRFKDTGSSGGTLPTVIAKLLI